jgi:hypothetical protein
LDDDQEMIGSEDEENNYYNIGGDDYNNFKEDKGERENKKSEYVTFFLKLYSINNT